MTIRIFSKPPSLRTYPSTTSTEPTMNTLAKRLHDIELLDEHGHPVTIGSAWAEGPALLVFVRHFG